MTPIDLFALARNDRHSVEEPRSELIAALHRTGRTIAGVVLEAQYRCGDKYLLLTTEDIPYEEALHVILVNSEYSVLDHLTLGHPGASGILTDLHTVSDEILEFSFFGEDRWRLTILSEPRFLLPSEVPLGVSPRLRRMLRRRLLSIGRVH